MKLGTWRRSKKKFRLKSHQKLFFRSTFLKKSKFSKKCDWFLFWNFLIFFENVEFFFENVWYFFDFFFGKCLSFFFFEIFFGKYLIFIGNFLIFVLSFFLRFGVGRSAAQRASRQSFLSASIYNISWMERRWQRRWQKSVRF